jgi:predicted chitinase
LPYLNEAMADYGITTAARAAAFLAQIAHESVELRYWEEIASGEAYEGRRDLGNTKPGDGKRYKGRGPIQITGRANYRKYGGLLGLDLENNPSLAATTPVGFRIAGEYWDSHGLNELADRQDFVTITKRINGGTNGLASRQKYYEVAKRVLGASGTSGSPCGSSGGSSSTLGIGTPALLILVVLAGLALTR